MLAQYKNATAASADILENVPLHNKNWFGVGGNARFFTEPKTIDDFAAALAFAREHMLAIFVLGEGANILISDDGFDGLVIRPNMKEIDFYAGARNETHVTAGAGVRFGDLITACLKQNIVGLEEFSGIPGTVGGSVFINIHYFEFLLSSFLIKARVINRNTGQVMSVDRAWFKFGYNESTLQHEPYYLVDATFRLRQGSAEEGAFARGRSYEMIRHRTKRYPHAGTCGSFFRNFHDDEVTQESGGKKVIWVAYYLDKVGVKGSLSIGNVGVSHQHANMLVNHGDGTAADIIAVACEMQERVRAEFGIIPQPECQFIGFTTYPLLGP